MKSRTKKFRAKKDRIRKFRVELKKWLFRKLFPGEYKRLKDRQEHIIDLKNRNEGYTMEHYKSRLDELNIILDILGEEKRTK